MRKDRLLKLADFLETVPRDGFCISYFGAVEDDECGFSGCAVGWAAFGKLFDGLIFDGDNPVYEGKYNWDAVDAVFEFQRAKPHIESADALYLFSQANYTFRPGPQDVADRIRKFVKDAEAR